MGWLTTLNGYNLSLSKYFSASVSHAPSLLVNIPNVQCVPHKLSTFIQTHFPNSSKSINRIQRIYYSTCFKLVRFRLWTLNIFMIKGIWFYCFWHSFWSVWDWFYECWEIVICFAFCGNENLWSGTFNIIFKKRWFTVELCKWVRRFEIIFGYLRGKILIVERYMVSVFWRVWWL